MEQVFLSTGSNMGDRLRFLKKAVRLVRARFDLEVLQISSVYETAAWGKEDQAAFYNQVIGFQTSSSAKEILRTILSIEEEIGRERKEHWGPRTIDIDLLFCGQEIKDTRDLSIPHPRLHERRFVLEPLCELAPEFIHPVLGKTIATLREECPDDLKVLVLDR